MIGIPENDLAVEFAKLPRADGLDASLSPDRHEGGGVDHAMSCFEPTDPAFCAFIRGDYFKHTLEMIALPASSQSFTPRPTIKKFQC